MREVIYFSTKKQLDKESFEAFLASIFQFNDFCWTPNFYSYASENEIDHFKTYISFDTSYEGYKYHYSVFNNDAIEIPIKNRVQTLKKLSAKVNIEILSTDDEVAPFSWVLIEPNGQTSTIQTKLIDDLIMDGYYNFPFGDFRVTEPLTEKEQTTLKEIIKDIYPNVLIEHSTDRQIINEDFNKVKSNYQNLKKFNNHYEIRPIGKNEWIDREEKSIQFVLLMKKFRVYLQKDICVFPRNFSEVKNIEGGSDSEEHCILLTALGQEKIIYKERRKSWLKFQ
ncbi:hypothetical protein WAF17_09130 [Bernardetia sp. ABR2-2B]|uniref:hypothetical protein n=1 Tax=Bernardetia sp. ABR2-2B TaxID=3127472 RepID=UPI0030CE3868